ncbi:rhamnan synthesis F family protein [Candidatus Liberibacter solanacearum]|uniref:Uncharacterized protein n=1 Tax=Candidatus Liberibacter solanacearum TaxID=556287 RepID=A0A1V2N742_9HYPH|nr:rhamnan synthesis F family protein [Candidatus Liberibacter solanacearum]ONI58633.1 hypothetical protein AYO25_04840 [Candidatus Liberibacter solanacearum]ONI59606.1 hypothetical protein AYJ09_04275 [Candidatus Liberibacter solanacearum]
MIFFPIVYRLIPKSEFRDCSICNFQMVSSKNRKLSIFLPVSGCRKGYLLFVSRRENWNFDSNHLVIRKVSFFLGFFFWIRSFFLFKCYQTLCYDENRIIAYGSRIGKKFFACSNNHMIIRGVPFDGEKIHRFPRLLHGWDSPSSEKIASVKIQSRIAIVIHIYYADLWAEIANLLSGLNFSFDLHITLVTEIASIKSEILKRFPNAHIYVMENYGRDIRPFLKLLEGGKLDSYDYVCKIHGKKSKRKGHVWWDGDLWRRWLFFDLLGAPGIALEIIKTFEKYPKIGMIGSRSYRYPNKYCDQKSSLGNNREFVCAIANKMGVSFEDTKIDFFAGTMFWVRPQALDPIKKLALTQYFKSKVDIGLDGSLEHAIERCFSISVKKSNFYLADVDCFLEESDDKSSRISSTIA